MDLPIYFFGGTMIKKVTEQGINQAVRYALKMNQVEEMKSSFLSSKRSLVKKDFVDLFSHNEHLILGDYQRFSMRGLIVCYKHPHQDFMDCAGPFYDDLTVGQALIEEVLNQTSFSQNVIFFFDHRHQELIKLIKSFGGYLQGDESQLILKRGQEKNISHSKAIQVYDASHLSWLKMTHDQLFPDSYIPMDDVLSMKDSSRQTYLIFENHHPVGYLILKSYPDFLQRKTIEMIGVIEEYRHKGYGRALLSYAIRECFLDPRVTSIDLIVENVNTHALNLYTNLGFQVLRTNVNMMIAKKR